MAYSHWPASGTSASRSARSNTFAAVTLRFTIIYLLLPAAPDSRRYARHHLLHPDESPGPVRHGRRRLGLSPMELDSSITERLVYFTTIHAAWKAAAEAARGVAGPA